MPGSSVSEQPSKPQKPDMSPFRPPNAPLARLNWRWRMWVGGTFATSMLESWEVFMLVIFTGLFFLLLIGGMYRYLPRQIAFLAKRFNYYLMGTDVSTDDVELTSSHMDL